MSAQTSAWQPIDAAPKDGTFITGRNADGDEMKIKYDFTVKAINKKGWISGIDKSDPNWHVVNNFYPVEWKSL